MDLGNELDPISPGYSPREGSLTGFTSISDDTITTMLQRGWSKEQLRQAILNLQETYGDAGIQPLLALLLKHVQDKNNPHHVTVAQITDDVIGSLIQDVFPGTPPSTTPIFGVTPDLEIPSTMVGYSYQGGVGGDNALGVQVADQAGYFHPYSGNAAPTTYRFGHRAIPLWRDIQTTTLQASTPLLSGTVVGTVPGSNITIMGAWRGSDSITFLGVVADSSSPTQIGRNVVLSSPTNAPVTSTFFMVAGSTATFLTIERAGNTIVFDLNALTATSSNPQVDLGDIEQLPNGVFRITHVFTATSDTISMYVTNGVLPTDRPTWAAGTPGMALTPLQITADVVPLDPITKDTTSLAASSLTGTLSQKLQSDCMVRLNLAALPYPGAATGAIMTFGGITVEKTDFGYRIGTQGDNPLFVETQQSSQYVKMAFSLSKTAFIVKFQNETKRVFAGDYSGSIPTDTAISLSNFNGCVRDIVVYAESDRDQMLEFLVDG